MQGAGWGWGGGGEMKFGRGDVEGGTQGKSEGDSEGVGMLQIHHILV